MIFCIVGGMLVALVAHFFSRALIVACTSTRRFLFNASLFIFSKTGWPVLLDSILSSLNASFGIARVKTRAERCVLEDPSLSIAAIWNAIFLLELVFLAYIMEWKL